MQSFEQRFLISGQIQTDATRRFLTDFARLAKHGHNHVDVRRRSHRFGDARPRFLREWGLVDIALGPALSGHGATWRVTHLDRRAELLPNSRERRDESEFLRTVTRPPRPRMIGGGVEWANGGEEGALSGRLPGGVIVRVELPAT